MRTDQYRFHLLDSVAFDCSLNARFEFGHANRAKGYMSGVAYWYADRAIAEPLPRSLTSLLKRPKDRFELPGLMMSFFLLERAGLYANAAARMDFWAQRYRKHPWSDLLRVRAVGYRECVAGFDAQKAAYESLAHSNYAPAAQAVRDSLWIHENSSHALLGIHCLGRYRLMLDGRQVATGDGKNNLCVSRIVLPRGPHRWELDLIPVAPGSHCSICLRSQTGDLTFAGPWDVLDAQPVPGRPLPNSLVADRVLPNMSVWAFEPNGYVNMQSPAAHLEPWAFWESRPAVKRVRLSKDWTFGECEAAPNSVGARCEEELRAHAVN